MITLSKFYSAALDSLKRRVLTVYQFGAKTADEVAPFGDDSNPVQGMDAIYADTSNDNEKIIIGYLNTNQMAAPGEKRFYSMKPIIIDGKIMGYQQAFYTWMKSNGTFEIGGTNDNLIRYAALNAAMQAEVVKINAELAKIQISIASGVSVGLTPYNPTNITLDISASQINEITCL